MEKIAKAFDFAYKAHKGQTRKASDIPYIIHPIEVAVILIKNKARDNVVISGLLHDVVEDTPISLEKIRNEFGEEIARLVDGATEPLELRQGNEITNWKKRKRHTIKLIKTADIDLKMLSCADKLANIQSKIEDYEKLKERLWKKFNAPKEDQEWYYRSMLKSYRQEPSIAHLNIYKELRKNIKEFFSK